VSRSTYKTDENGQRKAHILDIIPPDEYVDHVDDSVYSNYVASIALKFAVQAAQVLNATCSSCNTYSTLANDLVILEDTKQQIHPEYLNYPGNTVKQADVVLLHYPLGMPMSETFQRNDLEYYSTRTDTHGPAMTWGMHAIGFLDLGDNANAAKFFNMSFQDNMHTPFQVWTETPDGNAVNFITGAGGFLQTMVNGYGGLRIDPVEGLMQINPQCPENSDFVKFRGVNYLNEVYDIEYVCDGELKGVPNTKEVSTMTITMRMNKNAQNKVERKLQVLPRSDVSSVVYEEILSSHTSPRVHIHVRELRMKYGRFKFALRA
jgi:trehalose/maltose hydrolase-like predicted phosphorylase